MQHFSELNLCSALQNNLDKNEFVTPTPVQAQAIPPLMQGRDVLATADWHRQDSGVLDSCD
jgi:ATP-dependent RNA helicase RhlE